MDSTPRITTVLRIGGRDFSPDDLTSVVGIEPTKKWHQKLRWLKAIAPEISTVGWEYRIDKQRKWSLGEAIAEVLDVFWPRRDELKAFLLKHQLRVAIECRPFGDASALEYIIQSKVIEQMAVLGASLTLAVYKYDLEQGEKEGEKGTRTEGEKETRTE